MGAPPPPRVPARVRARRARPTAATPVHQGPELEQHTRLKREALLPCLRALHALHAAAPTQSLQAVRKKYSPDKQGAVSGIPALPTPLPMALAMIA